MTYAAPLADMRLTLSAVAGIAGRGRGAAPTTILGEAAQVRRAPSWRR